MIDITLESPLGQIIGGPTAKEFERSFGITTLGELIWHLPRRYLDRGELTPLIGLPVGEHVTVLAKVQDVRQRRTHNGKSLLEARITDGIGSLTLTFFNQNFRAKDLVSGARGIFSGKVSEYRGTLQLQHPDYKMIREYDEEAKAWQNEEVALEFAKQPVPVYPATAKLPSWVISKSMHIALDAAKISGQLVDPMPQEILRKEHLLKLGEALELAHRPKQKRDWMAARKSLLFREAFNLQLSLLLRKQQIAKSVGTARAPGGELVKRFDESLPFQLTQDQQTAAGVIRDELNQTHPMHRLLQGEVGSGKTVVALRAMLQVADSGGQSALLAPTEVLADQHFRAITESLGQELTAELHPVLLKGAMTVAERKQALLALASGHSRIAVGTHALFSEQVTFFDLGLIVVDEQHRFGVDQREALRAKGITDNQRGGPHVLAMTATPIPRTVALTAFGDLEVSTIRELPAERKGIETFVVPELEMPKRVERVWQRMAEDIAAGRQAYVVCPTIESGSTIGEESDELFAEHLGVLSTDRKIASVSATLDELRAMPMFKNVRIAALTGAMSSAEKDQVMNDFARGTVQILVATTVIEVGVNVPNASIMVVRDAERFGMSQLHQLRGRVGRGEHAGLCLLMTAAELGTPARMRVEKVASTTDGFALADADLEMRREGDILGTAQSGGKSTLKLLRVAQHGDIIENARNIGETLLAEDADLSRHPALLELMRNLEAQTKIENLAKS